MPPLTAYEVEQVHRIAGWKAEPPSYIGRAIEKLSQPVVRLAEKLLPKNAVRDAVQDTYAASEVSAHQEKVLERAGAVDLRELRRGELDRCDQLAEYFAIAAEKRAMFWGASMGGTNPLGALISVKAVMGYCLQAVHTIGYCYGFGTTEPHERNYVLGIMLIASAGTLEEKQHAIVTLGKIEDMIFEETFEELVQDAIAEQILTSTGLSSIPILGMIAGAAESARLTQQVVQISRFTFQERWLRSNHNHTRIPPDRAYARSLPKRVAGQVASALYWTSFGATFLISVPTIALFGWIPGNHAVGRGFADGCHAAGQDVQRLLPKTRRLARTSEPMPVAAVAAAPGAA
ncbi:MAG: hypothetical protein EXS05_01765 [Planctomycetaceae bacterium]|nr:hypothetical protein [Planctomycetaceae bacterium]